MRRFGGMASSVSSRKTRILCGKDKTLKRVLQISMEEKKQRNSSPHPSTPLPDLKTLKLNKEFKRAYYQGKNKATPYFICYRVKNRGNGTRYGLTTSKKVGNAVCRNKARRLLRAAIQSVRPYMENHCDYVFVARERILTVKSYQVAAVMKGCLKELQKNGKDSKKESPNS